MTAERTVAVCDTKKVYEVRDLPLEPDFPNSNMQAICSCDLAVRAQFSYEIIKHLIIEFCSPHIRNMTLRPSLSSIKMSNVRKQNSLKQFIKKARVEQFWCILAAAVSNRGCFIGKCSPRSNACVRLVMEDSLSPHCGHFTVKITKHHLARICRNEALKQGGITDNEVCDLFSARSDCQQSHHT